MEKLSFGQDSSKKKKKKKVVATSGFNIVDDDDNFRAVGRTSESTNNLNQKSIMIEGHGMISIDKSILKTADDDDIKPVLVTDISAEKIQEILEAQKNSINQKSIKKQKKEAKKKEKQRQAQWVEIDDKGNKVKAFVDDDDAKKDEKRRDRKERK